MPLHRLDPAFEAEQVERTVALRRGRDGTSVEAALAELAAAAAREEAHVVEPIRAALASLATVGEVCGVLRAAWGTHDR